MTTRDRKILQWAGGISVGCVALAAIVFGFSEMPPAPRLVPRGGNGPLQPVWDHVVVYSAEWWRRYRDWHREEFPDAHESIRANIETCVAQAEERERAA